MQTSRIARPKIVIFKIIMHQIAPQNLTKRCWAHGLASVGHVEPEWRGLEFNARRRYILNLIIWSLGPSKGIEATAEDIDTIAYDDTYRAYCHITITNIVYNSNSSRRCIKIDTNACETIHDTSYVAFMLTRISFMNLYSHTYLLSRGRMSSNRHHCSCCCRRHYSSTSVTQSSSTDCDLDALVWNWCKLRK